MTRPPTTEELLNTELLGRVIDNGRVVLGFAFFSGIYGYSCIAVSFDPVDKSKNAYISPIDGKDPWRDVQKTLGGGHKLTTIIGIAACEEHGIIGKVPQEMYDKVGDWIIEKNIGDKAW